jgi:hypothetical protein
LLSWLVPQAKADYAALCHAAEKGSLSMVQLLLAKGANPYTYDDTGYCAYDYLVDQAKPLELLAALLKTDAAFAQTQRSYQQVQMWLLKGIWLRSPEPIHCWQEASLSAHLHVCCPGMMLWRGD